ncbi:hypothetical protein [Rhodoferax sp.]|uniref:hypothetical protein n=1 Tax=Rhodoferax sp. TaxID=50421 RepID=UPI00374CF381
MTIDALPTPAPSPTDTPAEFNAHAFALLGALPTFISQTNSTATDTNAANASAVAAAGVATTKAAAADASATSAGTSAGTATTQAGIATTKAGEASTSATAALASKNSAAASAAAALGQIFATGTRMAFAQSAAPTGWTRDVSDNADNRMFRVVKTGGGGVGGSHSPILNDVVPLHVHPFNTGNQSNDHNHPVPDPGHVHDSGVPHDNAAHGTVGTGAINGKTGVQAYTTLPITSIAYTGVYTTGASTGHSHAGTSDGNSSASNWTPRYIDFIIATKD